MNYEHKFVKHQGENISHIGKSDNRSKQIAAIKKNKESQLSKYGPLSKNVSPKLDKKLKKDFPYN